MKKYLVGILISSCLLLISCNSSNKSSNTVSSNSLVNKVANEICYELNTVENVSDLSELEVQVLIGNVLTKYDEEWSDELERVGNPNNTKQSKLDFLLSNMLQQDCEKYQIVDNVLDKSYLESQKFRNLYLNVKAFVISAETNVGVDSLLSFFGNRSGTDLKQKLKTVQAELQKYKRNSGIYIMKRERGLIFNVNVFDYESGDGNFELRFQFKDTDDNLIDDWIYFTKEELRATELEAENDLQEMEITPIAPPLPPESNRSGK